MACDSDFVHGVSRRVVNEGPNPAFREGHINASSPWVGKTKSDQVGGNSVFAEAEDASPSLRANAVASDGDVKRITTRRHR
ncbi:hypothetical protein GCM10027031_14620 [Corynebacterium atrinae]